MANEFKHVTVGTELTQAEYESITGHAFDSQATGDIPYASSASQISRLAIGTAGYILASIGGVPTWVPRDIGARVYNDANQSIPNNVTTTLTFNSELWDTDTIHDNSTNNSRLTCKTAGRYLINGQVRFAASAVGRRQLFLLVNATTQIASTNYGLDTDGNWRGQISSIWPLAVNEYVELQAYQNSGGALNVEIVANYANEFMMQRIG